MKILITGASKGIGLFLMQRLLEEGYNVFGTYHSSLPPVEFSKYCTKVDITNNQQVYDWVNNVSNNKDKIVLINCASSNYNTITRKADVEKWNNLINVNLTGTFRVIHAVLPLMYDNGFGRIINLSSVLSQKGAIGTSAYSSSKAALSGMAKSIAVENARNNITVNNINLGYFNIGMTLNDIPEKVLTDIMELIPMKKLGNPENILLAVKFLIDADYITGSSIDINGGLY